MKLSTVSVALGALVAGATFTSAVALEAATAVKESVSWSEVKNHHAKHWKIFAQPRGTDLLTVKPLYHGCKTLNVTAEVRDEVLKTFQNNKDFEFVQTDKNHILANCINCSESILGNYYYTKLSGYIDCTYYGDKKLPKGDGDDA